MINEDGRYNGSLHEFRWSEVPPPPCEKFNCNMAEYCSENLTCCDAYIIYIDRGRSIDPRSQIHYGVMKDVGRPRRYTTVGGLPMVSRERFIEAHKGSPLAESLKEELAA